MVFDLSDVPDNTEGWGPMEVPGQYAGIPFAPYEKRTFIGRMADWSARAEQYREQRMRNRPKEVANEAFTAATEDDAGFALVDTKAAVPNQQYDKGMRGRGGRGRFGRGRGRFAAAPMGEEAKFNAKFGKKVITAPVSKWRKNQQASYNMNRWNDQKPIRTREASVDVRPEWVVKGQITFPELQKMSMEAPPEPSTVYTCGTAAYYDKQFDRVNPKAEKPIVSCDEKSFYKTSTSDDTVIAKLHDDPKLKHVRVYATDQILAVIMAAPRSAYSWDLVINRVGDKLFIDKRPDCSTDYTTCMETANDFGDEDKESVNHPFRLMQEATYINQAFSQQVLSKTEKPVEFDNPRGPFVSADDEVPAPVSYRYRTFTLGKAPKDSSDEDKRVTVLCRCELDGVMKGKQEEDLFLRLYAMNELDAKATAGVDWRQKLDSQRGAVLATELKNNSNKLARWTLQAMLAGADLIKLGYVSRVNPKIADKHVLLATGVYKPHELAPLINLNVANSWGILKAIVDLCLQLEEGKYLLLKDPNKPVVRFYSVPTNAFDEPDEPEALPQEDEGYDPRD
jgi:translation initiation factor 3 subunit D